MFASGENYSGVRAWDYLHQSNGKAFERFDGLYESVQKKPELFLSKKPTMLINTFYVHTGDIIEGKVITLGAFYKTSDKYYIDLFKVELPNSIQESPLYENYTRIIKHISMTETNFSVYISLLERKITFNDSVSNISMVFPIGVGAINDKVSNKYVTRLMTPNFGEVFLSRKTMLKKRRRPSYFKAEPFIWIMRGTDKTKDITPFGLHIKQSKNMKRGFVSHGCMRMRTLDIRTVYQLMYSMEQEFIPLIMTLSNNAPFDHPYPKDDKRYNRLKNFGTPEEPMAMRGEEDNLQIVETIYGTPPVEEIHDYKKRIATHHMTILKDSYNELIEFVNNY